MSEITDRLNALIDECGPEGMRYMSERDVETLQMALNEIIGLQQQLRTAQGAAQADQLRAIALSKECMQTSDRWREAFARAAGIAVDNWERDVTPKVAGQRMDRIVRMLRDALLPFADAARREADPIPDSDLDNEQPRRVLVTLGDCRRAERAIPARIKP